MGARLGDLALAANAILMQMVHLLAYGLDGFAFAAEALVGGALGARSLGALREAVVASTIWALIVAVGVAIIYLVGGPLLIAVMTDQPDVQATAERTCSGSCSIRCSRSGATSWTASSSVRPRQRRCAMR